MRALLLVLLALLMIGAGLAVGVVVAEGAWQDLWLNLLAETAGAALIVFLVDRIMERGKRKDGHARRRAAIEELRRSFVALREWLVQIRLHAMAREIEGASDVEIESLEALLNDLPGLLGAVDFAAPAPYRRDRYFVEWAKRSFDESAVELARWERNFAGSAGIFDDEFRAGAEALHLFVREIGSFLSGMERYILREQPAAPVYAFDGVTELTENAACRLASRLRDSLNFYRDQFERYGGHKPFF